MSDLLDIQEYTAPGPVAQAFLDDPSFGRFIMGPQGSGKTGACCFDLLNNAGQMPVCADGYRRFRVVAVRNTYGDLTKTIESWWDWIPKEVGSWKGGENRPASHKLHYDMEDCYGLKFEMRFLAVENLRIENVFRGNEFTAGWMNEADLLAPNVLPFMSGRAGRYPPRRLFANREKFRRYVIGDFNAPDIDNYLYKELVEEKPDNFAFFHQPSGESANAENVENLPDGYYDEQVIANKNKTWWINRMVKSQWGYSRDGEPVYPEYNDRLHCAPDPLDTTPLEIVKGLPLYIGLDAGMTPAAVIGQWLATGQFRILREIVPGHMGVSGFFKLLKEWLDKNMPDAGIAKIIADPSAFYGGDKEHGDLSWVETGMAKLDMDIEPAPSNELHPRLESVRQQLTYLIDGEVPALRLSPCCRILRKGFAANYRYKKMQISGVEQFADKPEKNGASHPHDALQYLIYGAIGRFDVITGSHTVPSNDRYKKDQSQLNTNFNIYDC